jgi:hypothetical protein
MKYTTNSGATIHRNNDLEEDYPPDTKAMDTTKQPCYPTTAMDASKPSPEVYNYFTIVFDLKYLTIVFDINLFIYLIKN